MNTDLMFSSESDKWSTPPDFFAKVNEVFNFKKQNASRTVKRNKVFVGGGTLMMI